MLKGWKSVFNTADRSVVEEECRKNCLDYQWKKNGGLRLVNTETAVERHPVTGDKVWFNQLGVSQVIRITMIIITKNPCLLI